MATPCNLLVTPAAAFTAWKELNFQGLYLCRFYGDNANQAGIVSGSSKIGIGAIVVHNWAVYDAPPGPDAKLVARAQGSHIKAGKWFNSFSLVFENERFNGSTLEVAGLVVENGEWAIVGGTGEFAMASGIIFKKEIEDKSDRNIIQITIRAFCPVLKEPRYPVTKIPPVGGTGTLKDIPDAPKRLQSITVATGIAVKSIAFSYVDYADQNRSAGPWGGPGGQDETETIQLAESEVLTQVSGTMGNVDGATVITSIKFVTSLNKTYGPYGAWGIGDDKTFSYPEKPGSSIVGFSARTAGKYVDAIGVYLQPL